MNIVCILCDQPFEPTETQKKKLIKHPHKIQICPDCKERITQQTKERQIQKVDPDTHSNI